MSKKTKAPMLTLDDFIAKEKIRVEEMSEDEKLKYAEVLAHVREETARMGMKKISLEELLDQDREVPYVTRENLSTIVKELKEPYFKSITFDGKRTKWRNKIFISAKLSDIKRYQDDISGWFLDQSTDLFYCEKEEIELKRYEQLFSQMDAIVVLVTDAYIKEENRARAIDIKLSHKYDIPLIPIIFGGNVKDFNEVVGNIELLDPQREDFLQKVTKKKEKCLIKEVLYKEIKRDFRGKVFLSYRKKDLVEAELLMGALRQDERFWDISIWYDDYLTPGEDYDEEIDREIEKCDVFLLLVTENLLEEGNYVQMYEYPHAKKMKKKILAINAGSVDLEELHKKYEDLGVLLSIKEPQKICDAMCKELPETPSAESAVQHKYYMAMAYHGGVGVKKNRAKALSLLVDCINADYLPAICFMATSEEYYDDLSLDKKIEIFNYALGDIEKDISKGNYDRIGLYWEIATSLSAAYFYAREYKKQRELLQIMLDRCDLVDGRRTVVAENKARVCFRMALASEMIGDRLNCETATIQAAEIIDELMEEDFANKPYDLFLLIANCELKMYARRRDVTAFRATHKKVLALYEALNERIRAAISFEYAEYYQAYANNLFALMTDEKEAIKASHEAIDLLLKSNNKMTNALVSASYNVMASYYFQTEQMPLAIEAAENAVAFAEKDERADADAKNAFLSKALFNCANICFQSDETDKAERYFIRAKEQCEVNVLNNLDIYHYVCNYYAQLLVIKEEYAAAISQYIGYINKMIRLKVSTDESNSICADFSYRIAILASKYTQNSDLVYKSMSNVIAFIKSIREPSEEMQELLNEALSMFS